MPPARSLPPADDLFLRLQGALAGEYSIERELGRGGMGIVYLAREVRLAREVAIKVLPSEMAADPTLRDQFFREARTAARLSHPNIVPIHRVHETDDFVFFVMSFIDGETLTERVRAHGPLPPHQAARVLRDVSWALTYAHGLGLVHRDIKADNIMIERASGRTVVMDFGIASVGSASPEADGRIVGSPHYVSPEQIAGEPLDGRSDLYSLGVTGYLLLTGRLPFEGTSTRDVINKHLSARPVPVASVAPMVPAKLSAIVDRCMAKRAEHRYENATALAEALDAAVEPPREIPAPIRVWLTHGERYRGVTVVAALYVPSMVGVSVGGLTLSPIAAVATGLLTLAAIITLPTLNRTRRVLAAGYRLDDLRAGLREHLARRREELAYEMGYDAKVSSKPAFLLAGTAAAIAVAFGSLAASTPWPTPWAAPLITLSTLISLGGALVGLRRLRQRSVPLLGTRQMKFWNGAWGERVVKLASLWLTPRVTATSLPQLTEVALGRATDALYDALPRDMKKQLKDLPPTVRRLEQDASRLRAEIDSLDSVLSLDADLRDVREQAADRLAATVAALENIRLDLLRLHLRDGHVASVTATLDAARDVARDLDAFVAASDDVDHLLSRTGDVTAP